MLETQLEFGHVKNVVLKLLEQPTMSRFSAKIILNAKEKTKSIFNSVNADNNYYPENPTKTVMSLNEEIEIDIDSEHLPHLRANLNSTLRLIQASSDSIESVKYN